MSDENKKCADIGVHSSDWLDRSCPRVRRLGMLCGILQAMSDKLDRASSALCADGLLSSVSQLTETQEQLLSALFAAEGETLRVGSTANRTYLVEQFQFFTSRLIHELEVVEMRSNKIAARHAQQKGKE